MPPLAADLTLEQREAVIAFARTLRLGAQAVEVAQGPTPALTEAAAAPLSTQELAAPAPTQAASPATQAVVAPLSTQEVGAAVTGTVSGTVTNSTAGGGVPADLPQPAHFSADGQSRCRRRPAPSARAAATLRDVPYTRDAHTSSPLPRRRPYNSEVVDGDPASRSLTPPQHSTMLPISGRSRQRHPHDLQPIPARSLSVDEIVSFTNTSDRAFLRQDGKNPASVSVACLPSGLPGFPAASTYISAEPSFRYPSVLPATSTHALVYTIPTHVRSARPVAQLSAQTAAGNHGAQRHAFGFRARSEHLGTRQMEIAASPA